ncbi:MAG: XTP/dITP diphosphatase [bacterium]|nr:XTP/dITP diphosphatase [bacterium]
MDIVLATRNEGKVREFLKLLSSLDLNILSMNKFPEIGDIDESGATFKENALIKAKRVSSITGLITIADDSGLEVEALDGRPGVYSARYAGDAASDRDNYLKLLEEMKDLPEADRGAAFVCTIASCAPSGEFITTIGRCKGVIASAPDGEGGFGYDPVFYLPDFACTMASLPSGKKNKISHRGKAVEELKKILPAFLDKALIAIE